MNQLLLLRELKWMQERVNGKFTGIAFARQDMWLYKRNQDGAYFRARLTRAFCYEALTKKLLNLLKNDSTTAELSWEAVDTYGIPYRSDAVPSKTRTLPPPSLLPPDINYNQGKSP